ncbi:MAG: helicase-associated domain-containing protein [Micromonosporaceae bacterium]
MTSKLADQLRALSDEALGALLQLRPDLVVPVPADISALATRAQGRVSVARALDTLDQFTLEMLDGLRLARGSDGTASVDTLLALAAEAGADPTAARAAVDRLRARFLAYGSEPALRLVPAVDELCPPYPAGLGRPAAELDPAIAELVADPARLRRTLLSAPPEARAVLDRLAAGPPVGTIAANTRASARTPGRAPEPAPAPETPVQWLVAHRLLYAAAPDLVELPREVGVVLRRETGPLGPVHPTPPEIDAPPRPVSTVDSAGAGQAVEAVRQMEALLHALAETPTPVLRAGGLGVRDLRRLARDSGTTEAVAATLLEIAFTAGLLGQSDPSEPSWLPTPAYDTWRTASLGPRWLKIARTWRDMVRAPAMVGQRDDKEKLISALSGDVIRLGGPALRRLALAALAELPAGAGAEPDAIIARLAWQEPRRIGRGGGLAALARAALTEAAALGITGLGALTSYGRRLHAEERADPDRDPLGVRAGEDDPVLAELEPLLPVPVDHVLVQADLTVVVPGPPEPSLAAELALMADTESGGGATVYRVTAESVRRALDAGYPATDIHGLFRRRSRTPVPQALQYLIDDVARRHGGLRVGPASAYVRSEDEALLTEVLADRRLSGLSLRRLAPTVLASAHSTVRLLAALRDAGYAPVPEDATGAAVLTRPRPPRAPVRPAPRQPRMEDFEPPRLTGPRLAGVVEQIRLGDRLARAARRSRLVRGVISADGEPVGPTQAHLHALAVLQQALRDQVKVWVGYVDAHGAAAAKLVRPVSMGSGYLRAEDDRTAMLHTFALHRITSAVPEES